MSTIGRLFVSVLCTALATTLTPAQEHGKPAEKPAPVAKPAPAPVYVIVNNNGKHEVMTKEALDAKNKQLADEYTKALASYEKDKKAAEAAKTKFDGKEPKKATVATVGSEYPTKEAAEAALKKMDEKPKEAPKDPPKDKPKENPKK